MNWQLLIFISIIASSFAAIFRRVLMKDDKSDPYAYSIVFQAVVGGLILIYTLFAGFKSADLSAYFHNLVIMCVLYALANIAIFNAFKVEDAGTVRVIYGSRAVWVLIGSAIFLCEGITANNLLGTFFILAATVVLYVKKESSAKKKGILLAFLSGLFYGLAFVNDAFLAQGWDIPSLMAVEFLSVSAFMAIIRPKKLLKTQTVLRKKTIVNMLVGGAFYAILSVTTFLAYQKGGDASVIGPLGQTSTILTVLLGAMFLKEKGDMGRKLLAAVLTIVGVGFLV